MNNNIELLLSKAGSIIEKYETISCETGANFNIFEIADISAKETTVCRVLTELLSPTGHHGQKGAYLEVFLRNILKLEFDKETIENARVHREYPADKRRIDIVIEIGNRFIPIEVKIYAGEGVDQCYDYLKFANKKDKDTKVVYLTLDGHAPSEYSAKNLSEDDVLPVSFATDILNWLEKCIALPDTIRKAPIREILIQFISTIKRLTNQMEDKPKMDMIQLLSKSSENMRNAEAIHNTFISCRAEIIKKLYTDIEKKLEKEMNLKVAKAISHDYAANEYLRTNEFKYPGLNYIVGCYQDMDIVFRFEIAHKLYIGFNLAKNNERINDSKIINSDGFIELFNGVEKGKDSWWVGWDYIRFDNDEINFKHFNDNYFKLFDSDTFDKIVQSSLEQAKATLSKLKK